MLKVKKLVLTLVSEVMVSLGLTHVDIIIV